MSGTYHYWGQQGISNDPPWCFQANVRGDRLSKLDKFIDQPDLFFMDAFKKRKAKVANKLDTANGYFKNIGIPLQFDLQIVEQDFVKTAVKLSHANKISNKIVGIINLDRHLNREIESSKTSDLEDIYRCFGRLFKLFNHILSGKPIDTIGQERVSSLNKLTPESRAIYLQLKLRVQAGEDH